MKISKCYEIVLKNILKSDSKEDKVFAFLDNNVYYELLTNKKIYVVDDNLEFDVVNYRENNYDLIGIKVRECNVFKVSKFLKFITNEKKENMINNILFQENSVRNTLNKLDFYESNYVKTMKKAKFLKNY